MFVLLIDMVICRYIEAITNIGYKHSYVFAKTLSDVNVMSAFFLSRNSQERF